jgi:hypothetical protein
MKRPDDAIFISRTGIEVTVKRIPVADAPNSVRHIQIQYGSHQRPGTVVWLPDIPRCWPKAQQIIGYYCADRDNLGRQFRQRSPQEATGSGSEADQEVGVVDMAPVIGSSSVKEMGTSADEACREEQLNLFVA